MLYKQLSHSERYLIDYLFNVQGLSISQIARELNRNKSTISREIKRNSGFNGYCCDVAHNHSRKRQHHKFMMRLLKYENFTCLFCKFYDKRVHGVEATGNKIKQEHPEIKSPSGRQVFRGINSNKGAIKKKERLRMYYKKGRKRTTAIFSKFKSKYVLPIGTRPKYIDHRSEYGHGEIDFIIGKRASGFANLITLTERLTRETYMTKIFSKNPMKCNSVIYALVKNNNLIVKSITCDNGLEFQKIGILAKWLNIKVYFCEPYASYQRGSNEHANGLIRRYFSKGFDFNQITSDQLKYVEQKINNMPRKIFNGMSSLEYKNILNDPRN